MRFLAPPGNPEISDLTRFALAGLAGVSLITLFGARWLRSRTRLAGAIARFPQLRRLSALSIIDVALRPRSLFAAIVFGILFQGTVVVSGWIAALALGISVSPFVLGWIHLAVTLAAVLPLTIAGVGLREGTAVALLSINGVPVSEAVALSVVLIALELVLASTGWLMGLPIRKPGGGRHAGVDFHGRRPFPGTGARPETLTAPAEIPFGHAGVGGNP